MIKIMFVCTGNTCRSPMAEYLLKDIIKKAGVTDIKVTSAGLNVCENDTINEKAKVALKKFGIVVRKFNPKKAVPELCRKQNAVICMTERHKNFFVGFKNVYTISELTGLNEISDPYGLNQDAYDECAATLKCACEEIFELLNKKD